METNEIIDKEISFRGRVISVCLMFEDSVERILFEFFKPDKIEDSETAKFYLEYIIFDMTFNKKIELLRKIIKSKRFRPVIEKHLSNISAYIKKEDIPTLEKFIDNYTGSLTPIVSNRNSMAHGKVINPTGIEGVDIPEGNFILGNKFKYSTISKESVNEFLNHVISMGHVTDALLKIFVIQK